MRGLRAVAVALLTAAAAAGASAQGQREGAASEVRTLLQTGHHGSVLALECDESRGLVFSAGDDGTLRVWDLASRSIVTRIGVGRLPVTAIAVNPGATQVAVLESDGVRAFAVSAWDWGSARRLFTVALDGPPLFLRYSDGGSWLMLGESAWQGLRLFAAGDGSPVAFHPEGFGIVGFAEAGRSERTLLTYQPGGRLQYWEVASGNLTAEVRTAPYLSGLRISRDRRFAAGTNGSEVMLIDLVTGATRARFGIAGVRSLDIAPAADEVACVATSAGGLELSRWALAGDTFVRVSTTPGVGVARYAGSALVTGSGGDLRVETAAGERVTLARDELADVTGLAADRGLLAAAGRDWIWVFRRSAASLPIEAVAARNPLAGPTGLVFVDGRLFAWRQGEGTPAAVEIDPSTGAARGAVAGLGAPLLQLEPAYGRLVGLDRSGTVRLAALPGSAPSGGPSFSAWLPGTLCVLATSDRELVGGRTPIGGTGGSGTLLRINMRTGETVSVPGGSRSTYDLAWDPARGMLYSLGVDADGATVLMSHASPGFERATVLSRYEGEDLSASLALDAGTGAVYASLGYRGITVWDGTAAIPIPSDGRVPRRLAAAAGLLASVNRDATVSLWDPAARSLLGDLYLLASGDWCLLDAGGRWAGTDGAARLVRVLVGGLPAPDPGSYRDPR